MKVYGELIILVLLFITNIRVFSVKHARTDALVALAPLCLVFSILQIVAWNVDFMSSFIFVLALLVFLSNFHAMFRYEEKLFIDSYTVLMKIWAVLTTILTSVAIICAVYFFPVEYKSSNLNVSESISNFTGSFNDGFEPSHFYEKINASVYNFSAQDSEASLDKDLIVLFFPDKRGDTLAYKPYLQFLAQKGYNVYSADFFVNDCKWLHSFFNAKPFRKSFLVIDSLKSSQKFLSKTEFYSYNISLEYQNLVKILKEQEGSLTESAKFFLIDDVMGNSALEDIKKLYPEQIAGTFHLNSIKEYQTPGYGPIAQTNPLLARLLNVPKDNDGFYTKYLVLKTIEAISDQAHLLE